MCERGRKGERIELTCNSLYLVITTTRLNGLGLQETSCTNREEDGRSVCDTRTYTKLYVCSIDW